MQKTLLFLIISAILTLSACTNEQAENVYVKNENEAVSEDLTDNRNAENSAENNDIKNIADAEGNSDESANKAESVSSPKTVRQFFMALPEKYFAIECCEGDKESYLKNYIGVEDTKNGYMDGGGDAAQSTFRMAIFKRPDQSYIVALNVFGEMEDRYHFLDHNGGDWKDISKEIVPEFSKNYIYEIPRNGTTVPVFEKKKLDSDGENDLTEKGDKLYDLIWKDGEFTIKR